MNMKELKAKIDATEMTPFARGIVTRLCEDITQPVTRIPSSDGGVFQEVKILNAMEEEKLLCWLIEEYGRASFDITLADGGSCLIGIWGCDFCKLTDWKVFEYASHLAREMLWHMNTGLRDKTYISFKYEALVEDMKEWEAENALPPEDGDAA